MSITKGFFTARKRWKLEYPDYTLSCEGVDLYEDVELTDESIVGGKEVLLYRTGMELQSSQSSMTTDEGKYYA